MLDPFEGRKQKPLKREKQEIVPNIYTMPTGGHTPDILYMCWKVKKEKNVFLGRLGAYGRTTVCRTCTGESFLMLTIKSGIDNRKKSIIMMQQKTII